ncbi:MAG: molybdenum cofactor biosynthesis protein MoaB [Candidatus Bathyarchaeota archaeon]|nr:molybdenum cofactor biosynthesis protein MoaB [Candidatus Termiticorpusculum sp.]MCL1970940.1 molybdenum cofactor biosynthesis protein MoaB [Candidatus Termiticorpusculum sp.]
MSESSKLHKEHALGKLVFAIYICSTSRFRQMEKGEAVSDLSGELIQTLIQASGHTVLFKKIILDDKVMIAQAFKDCLSVADLDVIIFSGGTGVVSSDVTIEAVLPLLEKTLPGFGEFFRRLSFDEIGSSAVLSRAIAGVAASKAFFCIPGSINAVKTAVEKLILPEVLHIVKHARE